MTGKIVQIVCFVLFHFQLCAEIEIFEQQIGFLEPTFILNSYKIVRQLKRHEHTLVTFIQSDDGKKFCIKQLLVYRLRDVFCFICEVLASLVAESVGIPVNKVRFIPKNLDFPGKIHNERLATLLTFVPGKMPPNTALYNKIDLRQNWKPNFSPEQRGLTRSIIHDMSLHKDLPSIVAFDTFVSNVDRCKSNILFDESTDSFCGIDLEMSWLRPYEETLTESAYQNITAIMNDPLSRFSPEEVSALHLYNKTLKNLIKKNPPEKLYQLFDEIIYNIEFNPEHVIVRKQSIFSTIKDNLIQRYKKKMTEQYRGCKQLVALIDRVLLHYQRCKKII